MKNTRLFTTLLCAFALLPLFITRADELTATIKKEAQNCANAAVKSDYEGIVKYTHPRLINMMGGKDAMIAKLKDGIAEMHATGMEFSSATIGAPEAPKKFGDWLTSVVPEHTVMKVQGGRLVRDSYLLGISEDGGKNWVFVDLGQTTKEHFAQIFPELDGKITWPKLKQPVYEEGK